jgi:ribosomal-protein-alanine N-acetyltransferase
MGKINFTPFPNLETERLKLRQITTEDLNEFFLLKSDERILRGYNAKAKTYEEAGQFLQRISEEISKNEWINWGITFKGENKLIGSICFWNIVEEQSKAEIGYELMPEYQGKGIMSEAVKAVIEYGFENMRLDWIEAVPYSENMKSARLLERNNFVKGESFKESDSSEIQVMYRLGNDKKCRIY